MSSRLRESAVTRMAPGGIAWPGISANGEDFFTRQLP
jgi:hypothetical protein